MNTYRFSGTFIPGAPQWQQHLCKGDNLAGPLHLHEGHHLHTIPPTQHFPCDLVMFPCSALLSVVLKSWFNLKKKLYLAFKPPFSAQVPTATHQFWTDKKVFCFFYPEIVSYKALSILLPACTTSKCPANATNQVACNAPLASASHLYLFTNVGVGEQLSLPHLH